MNPQHMCCHSQGRGKREREMKREAVQLLAVEKETVSDGINFFFLENCFALQ